MTVLGLSITRTTKAAVAPMALSQDWRSGSHGWWPIIRESFAGAWQRGVTVDRQAVLAYSTVWACITLIAADISKLWIKLVEKDADGICTETTSAAFSPVLRKPNHYQTRTKFFEYWIICKLVHGNTYVLKERDARGIVSALYILDPQRVQVLVSPNGSVFYALGADPLSGIEAAITVPAREILHDIMVPLFHPLCGVSPIFACGLAATQALKIQQSSTRLFANGSNISGVLTAPTTISNENAERIQKHWEANFSGEQNIGKVAVLGDGLKFEPMMMTAVDAQLIDQLKLSDQQVCATFHVPGYKVGVGPPPPYTDIQSINLEYYTSALQNLIENLEVLLDEGLELPTAPRELHVEVDLSALLRMDTKTQVENATKGILGGLFKPNEARADFDLPPVDGGDTVYLQQQQYSLAALNRRDQLAPAPPTVTPPALPPAPAAPKAIDVGLSEDQITIETARLVKELELLAA